MTELDQAIMASFTSPPHCLPPIRYTAMPGPDDPCYSVHCQFMDEHIVHQAPTLLEVWNYFNKRVADITRKNSIKLTVVHNKALEPSQ